jgi:hypothetical protein
MKGGTRRSGLGGLGVVVLLLMIATMAGGVLVPVFVP